MLADSIKNMELPERDPGCKSEAFRILLWVLPNSPKAEGPAHDVEQLADQVSRMVIKLVERVLESLNCETLNVI